MGTVFVVGMGPGKIDMMTGEALEAIKNSDIVVGYTLYVELLKSEMAKIGLSDKIYESTPMKKEIERCRLCLKLASEGKKVALICSGDAGVYGMASPILELLPEYPGNEIVVIPGITAANSGAAVLGAPLNHDYCVISLSDLLTPWEKIEKRLIAAIEGDFAIAIYNPSSMKRADYLKKACDIMLAAGASKDRACGYIENIGREDTKAYTCTLAELRETQVNMFTTVFIGNSQSIIRDNRIITKRGYISEADRQ